MSVPETTIGRISSVVNAALIVVASEQDPVWRGRFTMDVHRRVMDAVRRGITEAELGPVAAHEKWSAEMDARDAEYAQWLAWWHSLPPADRATEIADMDAHVAFEREMNGEAT